MKAIGNALKDKVILITGGTGTFGRLFIPYLLANCCPFKIISLSRDWEKAACLEREIDSDKLRIFMGDILDKQRLRHAFRGVDVVIHAAAQKHVIYGEYNPRETIFVNVMGTINVADEAIAAGVSRVLLISSDKSVSALNTYGVSKAAAERYVVQANAYAAATPTRLACVRYGNVIGARGSVLETWAALSEYELLPVTNPLMTRFLITPDIACRFVLDALMAMQGGEVFVPKLAACTIGDLAEACYPGRVIEVSGVRPGEKMHEVLVSEDELRQTLDIGWAYVIVPEVREWAWQHDWTGEAPDSAFRSDTASRLSVAQIRERLNCGQRSHY